MLNNISNILIIGIKGVGMANLALILKKMGKNVSGSDVEEEFITDKWLKKNNIPVTIGFDVHNLPKQTDLVIYSAAHQGAQNPLVLKAKKRRIKVFHQAAFIAELMKQFKTTVAVAGSHGKTTTASLLAYAMIKLGAKPTYLVGSSDFNDYPAGDFGSYYYFVVEADEYAVDPPQDKTPKFNFLHPDIILCTNIDFDHPDVFANMDETKQAFSKFFKQGKKVIDCKRLKVENAVTDAQGTSFTFNYQGKNLGEFKLSLFGEKNALNAAGVIATLVELGFEPDQIRGAIKDFTGAKRRFEQKFSQKETFLFDDYAHHPIEIEATIKAAKERFKNRRIIVLFQSHTYSRTAAFLDEFIAKLSFADLSLVGPIFPSARENPKQFNINPLDFEKKAKEKNISNVKGFSSMEDLLIELGKNLKKGDVVFTMGAGNIYKLETDIIKLINRL